MKKILLAALIITSANAKWVYVKDHNRLAIINDDTGEIFQEFLGTMVRVDFTDGYKEVTDDNGKIIQILPSDIRRSSPTKK